MASETVALPEGTVTVLSTDLVGSTALNQRLGDEAATAVERELAALAHEQVEKQRGVVIKDTGDGLMIAFQSARRAIACAQDIQRAIARRNRDHPDIPVQLRVGLHTGEVLSDDGALHGETLIIAKRIETAAPAGAIFASDTVHGVLGTAREELQDRGDFALKGIDVPWHLWEVPWAEGEAARVLSGRERTPFVARWRERERLVHAAERARQGAGALLLIGGEAGVGKTRLVEEAAIQARRLGFRVYTGHCVDQQGAPPYLPVIEHFEEAARRTSPERFRQVLGENAPEIAKLVPELRARYPDIPEPVSLPPEQERRYVMHSVVEFVERNAHLNPMMLVYEDLHWADESTLLVIRHLAQRIAEIPVLAIGTYRDTDLKPGRPLAAALPDLLRQRLAEEILLGRLTEQGVGLLLEGRAGRKPPAELVALVYAETEGNPFFVEELFRHLQESGKLFDTAGEWRSAVYIADTEVPRSVSLIIGQRLDRVSDDCRRILTIAALAGKTFGFDLLAAFQGVDENDLLDALEEAVHAALIADASSGNEVRYTFVHETIRQTLLSLLSTPRRQRLHLRMADALEARYGTESEHYAAEIAHHLYQAGAAADGGRTACWLTQAAERALDALAFEEGLRHLDAARTVLGDHYKEHLARLWRLAARALRGLGRIDDALTAFAHALDVAPLGAERDAVLRARAQLRLDLFRGTEALADLEPLLARARQANDRGGEVELLLMRGRGLYIVSLDHPGHAAEARASYEQAYTLAKQLGDKRAMCQALIPTMWFIDYWHDYRAQAERNIAEAAALAAEVGDEDLQIEATSGRFRLMTVGAAPGPAHDEALRLRQRLEARRDPLRLKEHLFWLMWHHWQRAEFAQCVATCDDGIALAAQLGSPPVQYPSIKGLALTDLGHFDEAWAAFQNEVADEEHPFGRCMQGLGMAFWFAAMRALDHAEAKAKEVLEEAGRLSRTWMQRFMVELLTCVAAWRGRAGEELAAWVAVKSDAIGFRPTEVAQAELALARGDCAGALAIAEGLLQGGSEPGLRRGQVMALEIVLRALAGLERWQELLQCGDAAVRVAEETSFRTRAWRILAVRARARAATGDAGGAAADRTAASRLIDDMARRIADPSLRAAFLADAVAMEVSDT